MTTQPYSKFVESRFAEGRRLSEDEAELLHAALGVSGEAGELVDAIKKSVFYERPLDVDNVIEECGDILFYIQALLNTIADDVPPALTLDDLIAANIDKLSKRYHTGSFSTGQANARADKA